MKNTLAIILSLFALAPFAVCAAGVSPLASLSDAEKSYYEKVFDYSMEVVKPGEKYDWASFSGKGAITVDAAFISKSGATCRNFNETFNVQGQPGIDKGVGCKRRGKDGWCKLDLKKEAQTCSFEDTTRMFGGINVGVPAINMPNTGVINAPDVNSNVNTNVNTNVDTSKAPKGDITSKGYADTVTGTAGKAAGSAASNGLSWFANTFLR